MKTMGTFKILQLFSVSLLFKNSNCQRVVHSRPHPQSRGMRHPPPSSPHSPPQKAPLTPHFLDVPDINITHKRCVCPMGIIVIADSNSGSTWLSQLLDKSPCSSSFIPPGTRPDGKITPNNYKKLLNDLKTQKMHATRMRSYGVILSRQYLKRSLIPLARQPHLIRKGNNGCTPPIRVLVLARHPLFAAISGLKKQQLASLKKQHKVQCRNVNQRGGENCAIATTMRFSIDPKILATKVKEISITNDEMIAGGRHAANSLTLEGQRGFHLVHYSDLLCASATYGPGLLPQSVANFTGLGKSCGAVKQLHSFKSSPENPVSELRNFHEIEKYANKTRASWRSALRWPYEAWPCQGWSPSKNSTSNLLYLLNTTTIDKSQSLSLVDFHSLKSNRTASITPNTTKIKTNEPATS